MRPEELRPRQAQDAASDEELREALAREFAVVGRRMPRVDGVAKLTGRALYDEEVLRERRGLTDFSSYSSVQGETPPPLCREMVE